MSPSRIAVALIVLLLATTAAWAADSSVAGVVYDAQTGRPIHGVRVQVAGRSGDGVLTDSDGKFVIVLPPGAYDLKFTSANHTSVEVAGVKVVDGAVADASTVMANKGAVTSVNVVEKADSVGATAEAMLTERKLSPIASDGLSREELSSGASGDAAGAMQKVTGVSIVGEGFVYVRGLGERYSSTELNGAQIPTTEPEKRVVPLDLFPTGLVESIKVVKTYSPEMPAEFSGGLVQLKTIDFPAERMLRVSMKGGMNTATTRHRYLTYPGGSYDFFGFDDGTRALPSIIPNDKRLYPGQFSQSELQSIGRAFANNWEPRSQDSVRPDVDWSLVGGGTFGRLGLVGALTFNNKNQNQTEENRYLRLGDNQPFVFTEYKDYREYTETARLGGVLNAAVRLNHNHKLLFRNTLTHDTEKSAREFGGYDGGLDTTITSQRLRLVQRSLLATGIEGDHTFAGRFNSVLHWQLTYSRSQRDEPDLREVFRGLTPNGQYIFSGIGSSGIRFFSGLNDRIYEPQADLTIPFFKGKYTGVFKFGFRGTFRERDFQARRFRFMPQQTSTLDLYAPSNQLFAPENIRPSGFQIIEFTRATDKYDASMDIYAGYGLVDVAIGQKWRLLAGLRIEAAEQTVTTLDNLVPNARPTLATLANTDPAPGVNLTYNLSPRQNLRFSWSRTVSRPDFRELSPFDFNNTLGGFVTQGNPNLRRATVNNSDARWEWFPGGRQLIAASFFAKTFTDPIEQTVLLSNDLRQTFVNAKGARNIGIELEARRSLGTFHPRLRAFTLGGNFTFVDSNIDIRLEDAQILTSQSRPLLGQSRYVGNGMLEWRLPKWRSEARFNANYVSRRLSDVGTFQLPDIYQEGNVFLDFVYQVTLDERGRWAVRFEGENLANNNYQWSQGDFVQRRYRLGRTYQLGLTYTIF